MSMYLVKDLLKNLLNSMVKLKNLVIDFLKHLVKDLLNLKVKHLHLVIKKVIEMDLDLVRLKQPGHLVETILLNLHLQC